MSQRRASPPKAPGGNHQPQAALDTAAQIVATLADAVCVTGLDRRIQIANPACAALLGRRLEDLPGMLVDDCVAPADRANVHERQDRVFGGRAERYELRILRPDGEIRVCAVSSSPLMLNGQLIGSAATLRDITTDRREQETLARSEARYRNLFESASDAIVTLDANGRFTTVNHAAEEISGYLRAELVGTWFAPLIADEELPKALSHFQRALAGETGLFETRFYRKDGELRHIAVTYSTPQRDEEVLCLIRDVTDQKMLQEQLMQSEKMSAIGQLVSGVAHELNNPLAGISAFAQLLLTEKRLTQEQRGASETIYAESRRASRIVNNLLTFARQYKPEKGPTDLHQVLDDTLELRTYELRVRGIEITRDYDESIPDTMADAHQLQQVFLNLFTNAEQAMERADVRHHRLTVRTRSMGTAIRIEIEDTGPGVPPTLLDRIFNPFFTTKPTGTGTGLGLSISLGIVREHQGRIWAENLQSGGARFVMELPVTQSVPIGEHAAAPVPAPISERLRILVVDDEASVRRALHRYLESRGHHVDGTASGLDAIARLRAERYDAVILDLRMPDLPGQELYKRLRETDPDHADRVIFMTGDLLSETMQAFLDATGRPFVAKPFEFTAFDRALPGARPG